MKGISFTPELATKIIAGDKTVTRRPENLCKVGETLAVLNVEGGPPLGHIRILSTEQIRLMDISDTEARKEGFDTLQDFFIFWARYRPADQLDTKVWRIEFKLLKDGEQG